MEYHHTAPNRYSAVHHSKSNFTAHRLKDSYSSSQLETPIRWASHVHWLARTPILQAPNAAALPHTSCRRVVLMGCAASAAHAVILMLWTSDCRAGDYRQLLYPARWGRSRLLPNRLRRRAAWCDWFGWCGVGRVCGLVFAGSRTGVPVGVSRFGLFVPCPGVCPGVGGGLRLCSGM
jgi:hypothetical protein